MAMLLAIAFCAVVCSAGVAAGRLLRLTPAPVSLALAPALGLGLLIALTTWSGAVGAPPMVSAFVLAMSAVAGLGVLAIERRSLLDALQKTGWLWYVWFVLGLALLVPVVVVAIALAGLGAPLSTHDGAFHVETIQFLELGNPWNDWYPVGFHRMVAAFLTLVPWVDTAQAVTQAALGLALMAPLALFGMGVAVWPGRPLPAAIAALLLGVTFAYPYSPHTWGGWPLDTALLLVLGIWAVSVEYLRRPSAKLAGAAGLMVGAIVVTHGSELYTVGLGLPVMLAAFARRVRWQRLPADVGLGLVVAAVVAASYLPILLSWAREGGATAVGYAEGALVDASVADAMSNAVSDLLAGTLDVNPLARIVLVPLGVVWLLRARQGRFLIALGLVFYGLAVLLSFRSVPWIRTVYAVTFPWGQQYRLLYVAALAFTLMEGAGCCALLDAVRHLYGHWPWLDRTRHPVAERRLRRTTGAVACTSLVSSVAAVTLLAQIAAASTDTYTSDDAAAMGWLRAHAAPGEALANDSFADAGVWAPFKANMPVLRSRLAPADDRAQLVLDNVGWLERVPEAEAAACALHVGYVYRGAAGTRWEPRHFPPLETLRQSAALEQVFTSGDAAVFRTQVRCAR